MTYTNDGAAHKALIEEVLKAYPDKSRKRRQKHLGVATVETVEIGEDADALLAYLDKLDSEA